MSDQIKRYTVDDLLKILPQQRTDDGRPQCLPRRTWYGSPEAESYGLVAVSDYPDMVPEWNDAKEIIRDCEEKQTFAYFHTRHKEIFSHGFSQNGLLYCWAWSAAGSLMSCRAAENQDTVQLAPNSLGWLVNWRNNGYYLDATIKAMKERGVAPLSAVHDIYSRNPRTFDADWEEQALKYRVLSWWDCDRRLGTRGFWMQALSALKTARAGYAAWNRLSHAMQILGMGWDDRKDQPFGLIQNSHGETDVFEMTDPPDELYVVRDAA